MKQESTSKGVVRDSKESLSRNYIVVGLIFLLLIGAMLVRFFAPNDVGMNTSLNNSDVLSGIIDVASPDVVESAPSQETQRAQGVRADAAANNANALQSAISYTEQYLLQPNGHVDVYQPRYATQVIPQHNDTNSEAISYRLQMLAQASNKDAFDAQLMYVENYMLHPQGDYLMWRLNDKDVAEGEGQNIASDADLRAIRALYIANDKWHDPRYDVLIDRIARGLERVALTNDCVLLAYGGLSGETPWYGDVAYLAYSDFGVFDRLARTRGAPWLCVAEKMRNVTLKAQIWNGLYNSEYRPQLKGNEYGNGIDGGKYSINSLWIMVRFAESGDKELMKSARTSLALYESQFIKHGKVYDIYTSSGDPATTSDSPWNYALIARAAAALGETEFALSMQEKMLTFQQKDGTLPHYGGIFEGAKGDERVGQFTMHECILSMQEIAGMASDIN